MVGSCDEPIEHPPGDEVGEEVSRRDFHPDGYARRVRKVSLSAYARPANIRVGD
jgi:hypothetical protein